MSEFSESSCTSPVTDEFSERAALIGIYTGVPGDDLVEAEASLAELASLAAAAGAKVVLRTLQRRASPEAATLAGSGKLEELRLAALEQNANLLIFDNELSGSQLRNIEKITGMKVIDRTLLILDIFARRAQSREGRLQVELAQQTDRLSRLTGMGQALSRLGGGIGTRGPGESQLESDRRHILRRIRVLRQELERISERRDRTRERRRDDSIRSVAIVGYTNAGKSTLMNRLCASDVLVMDQVFATLDPTARKIRLPDQQLVLAVDTVGFIRRLPHGLVDAFRATLEEVTECDIIVQVIDVADPDAEKHLQVVEDILTELHAAEKPRILVLNKLDQVGGEPDPTIAALFSRIRGRSAERTVALSALSGSGVDELLTAISELARGQPITLQLVLPFSETGLIDYIRRFGHILELHHETDGIHLTVELEQSRIGPLQNFIHLA
jgi:GTP-binding protein HflX